MSQEIYANLTNKIIKALKAGSPPWRKPWVAHNPMPVNAASGRPYSGINVFSLWMAQEVYDFSSNLWGVADMWKRLGGSVYKKEYPSEVYLFHRARVPDKKTGKRKTITILKTFDVFNLDQVWGCIALRQKVNKVITAESQINFGPAEEIAENMGVETVHRGARAFYNPDNDRITLPPKTRFESQIGYWNTRFHELVHSTGHGSRLGRVFGPKPVFGLGGYDYAFEELIAEIGTAFVCSLAGIPEAQGQMPQHASYLRSWLSVLQEDEKAIFRAASAAQKAADFIMTGGNSAKPKKKRSNHKKMEKSV